MNSGQMYYSSFYIVKFNIMFGNITHYSERS